VSSYEGCDATFEDILVVTPLGAVAAVTVEVATELAATNDARLTLLDVVSPSHVATAWEREERS
jgi:hypothetical protein